ncbi:hypothetical protein OEZ86_007097 [Tetradesmus obliquus]|nr:hypothetical protein OEZ86_007097 [Tetradesmus obliquus]
MGKHYTAQLSLLLVALLAAAVSLAEGANVTTNTFLPKSCPTDSSATGMEMALDSFDETASPGPACFAISRSDDCDNSRACCRAAPTPAFVRLSVAATCGARSMAWMLDGRRVAATKVAGGVQIALRGWPTGSDTRELCVRLPAAAGPAAGRNGTAPGGGFPERHLSTVTRPSRCSTLAQLCGGDSCRYSLFSNTAVRSNSAQAQAQEQAGTQTFGRSNCCSQGTTATTGE